MKWLDWESYLRLLLKQP